MESVSASEFVRRFGEWRERAAQEPVYIHHHGRPRFVLASVEHMGSLVDRPGSAQGAAFEREQLLDLVDAMIIMVDDRLAVTGMSPQARLYFGDPEWRGKSLLDMISEATRAIILRSAQRVIESGYAETFELRSGLRARRRLDITVQPFADGLVIVARDLTTRSELIEAEAIAEATRESLTAAGDIAVVTLNLRGYIIRSNAAVERMTGLSAEALESVRMVTLFDTRSRAVVGEALESAIRDLTPSCVRVALLVNRGPPREVRVAFSARALRASIDSVVATIRDDTLP